MKNLHYSRRAAGLFSALFAAIFALQTAAAPDVRQAPNTAPASGSVEALVEQLADPDPLVRQQASDALIKLGARARPALVDAVNAGDPQIAPRAADTLLQLPWFDEHDPAVVKQLLTDYGKRDAGDRVRYAEMIAQFPAHISGDALIRLVQQDPSDTVRWGIMRVISQHMDDAMSKSLRNTDLSHATSPLLALAARAWLNDDASKALRLLQRAVELEQSHPTFDDGALDFAFDLLVSSARAKKQYDEAADLLRMEAKRQQQLGSQDADAVFELFALHAQVGPVKGIEQDLRQFQSYLGRQQTLYALSIMEARQSHALLSIALEQTARAAGVASQQSHFNTAVFLAAHDWTDLALREFTSVLQSSGEQKTGYDLWARLRLASITGDAGDDTAAANHLRAAVEELRDTAGSQAVINELVGQIAWREFRIARSAKDEATMKKKAEAVMTLAPTESSVALDLVPYLKEHGRADEAAAVFNRAYETVNSQLASEPTNPERMNKLAWLCARCDERIAEAVKTADRAVSLSPENYAILDTDAEANFRAGNAAKAVQLETRALELKPNDKFMLEQLARFKKGVKK